MYLKLHSCSCSEQLRKGINLFEQMTQPWTAIYFLTLEIRLALCAASRPVRPIQYTLPERRYALAY